MPQRIDFGAPGGLWEFRQLIHIQSNQIEECNCCCSSF